MMPDKKSSARKILIYILILIGILIASAVVFGIFSKTLTKNSVVSSVPGKISGENAVKRPATLEDAIFLVRTASSMLDDMQKTYAGEADLVMKKLHYSTIKKDPSGKTARTVIAELKKVVTRNRASSLKIADELSVNVNSLKLPDKSRRFLEMEALPAADLIKEKITAQWESEKLIVNLNEACIDQLVNKEPDWFLNSEGQLLFKYDEDLEEFQKILKKIRDEYKQQNQLRSDSRQMLNELSAKLEMYRRVGNGKAEKK